MKVENLKKWKYRLKCLLKESKSDDILKEIAYVNKQIKLLTEDEGGGGVAMASAANVGGMGAVVSAQPGYLPGTTGTTGSGDIGINLFKPQQKSGGLSKLFKAASKMRKKKGQKPLLSFTDYVKTKKK